MSARPHYALVGEGEQVPRALSQNLVESHRTLGSVIEVKKGSYLENSKGITCELLYMWTSIEMSTSTRLQYMKCDIHI